MTFKPFAAAVSLFLLVAPLQVSAQDTAATTTTTEEREDGFDFGWLGLLGLAGLLGLKRRDNHVHPTNTNPRV